VARAAWIATIAVIAGLAACGARRRPLPRPARVVVILDGVTAVASTLLRIPDDASTTRLRVDELAVHGGVAIAIERAPSTIAGALTFAGRPCVVVEAMPTTGEIAAVTYQGFLGTCVRDGVAHQYIVGFEVAAADP
jgi:hypothetical protein